VKTRLRRGSPPLHIRGVAVVVLLATIGCSLIGPAAEVGELRTKSESVPLGDAESVHVEINMAAGELAISGGANDLMEADFTYNVEELEPEVDYREGQLVVRTPDAGLRIGSLWNLDDYRYEWDLRFNDDVPMEMKVEVAAGKANLHLGSLSLASVEIGTGASEVEVDLADSSSLTSLNIDAGVGQTTVDLSGDWQDDLDANISSGVGELSVRLPPRVCVRVEVDEGLGEVRTQGLANDGGVYVNDACGSSDVTLRIDVSAGVGAVNLEVDE